MTEALERYRDTTLWRVREVKIPRGDWVSLVLGAYGRRYHLGYNAEEGRFARNKCLVELERRGVDSDLLIAFLKPFV